jgi:hypothetical protein
MSLPIRASASSVDQDPAFSAPSDGDQGPAFSASSDGNQGPAFSASSDGDQSPSLAGSEAASQKSEEAHASSSSGRRREILATLAIVGGLLGVVAGRPLLRRLARHPSEAQCAAMLDHYAEQAARAKAPSRPPPARPPLDQALAERCAHELTALEVDCAMKANTIDEIERCLP